MKKKPRESLTANKIQVIFQSVSWLHRSIFFKIPFRIYDHINTLPVGRLPVRRPELNEVLRFAFVHVGMSGDGESLVGVGSFVGTFGFVRPVDAFVARHVASNDDGHDDQGDKEKGQHSADHSLKGNAAPMELMESLPIETLNGRNARAHTLGHRHG